FDYDTAAIEVNRCALARLCQVELRTIFHLDERTVTKTNHGAPVFCGAHLLTLLQLRAIANCGRARVADLINLSFGCLHSCFEVSVRPEPLHKRNCEQSEPDDERRGNAPTQNHGLQ